MEHNITEKLSVKKLSTKEQYDLCPDSGIYYHMCMRFLIHNKTGASEVTLIQTSDRIPDDALIAEYTNAVYQSLINKTGACVKFTGYDYLYAVRKTKEKEKGDFDT